MDADVILITEGFSLDIYRVKRKCGGAQCVYSLMRRVGSVRRSTMEGCDFVDETICRAICNGVTYIGDCVVAKRDGDIVKDAEPDELTFSATKLQNAFSDEAIFKADVYIFFCWNSQKGNISIQHMFDFRATQSISCAEQRCHLRVMSTAMSCACLLVGVRMLIHWQRIHFAN